jgi:predicted lactoylglutathione lyase
MKLSQLIPMLPVSSISVSIDFYEKLGFSLEQRRDDWGWAMLRLDECRIMVDRSGRTPIQP